MEMFDNAAIAVDFDGVIADSDEARILFAKKEFGITLVPPVKRKIVVERDHLMTSSQYRKLQLEVGAKWEWAKMMEPVPGVLNVVPKLYRAGFVLFIVTSRTDEVVGKTEYPLLSTAIRWLKQQGLLRYFKEIKGVGYKISKAQTIKRLRPKSLVYMDDDIDKLLVLEPEVDNLFMLSRVHNISQETPSFIQRVDSWQEFYVKVCGEIFQAAEVV